MSIMVLYNDHGKIKLSDDDWENLVAAAEDYGWEPVDMPDTGHALSKDDAMHFAEALHAALDSGEVMPHELLDDPDAEEKLELFMELCESGPLLEK